jgi:LacI family transcriptional regulator
MRGKPVIAVDPVSYGDPDTITISATNWAGALAATEHLLSLGHRRIGVVTGPDQEACTHDRIDGYRAALRRAGIAADPSLVREGQAVRASGFAIGGALLDSEEPPTAIFSFSDEQAFGVYEAARERGLSIPQDLSIIGFDDVDLCEWMTPRLTTVRQPLGEMCAEAIRLIGTMADEDAPAMRRYELTTTLVVRESTAQPRTTTGSPNS